MKAKKPLLLVMAILIALSFVFAACGGGGGDKIEPATDYSGGDPAKKWYVSDKPIEIKVFFRDRLDFSVEDSSHNSTLATLKKIEEKTNVRFKWQTALWDMNSANQQFTSSIGDPNTACDLYVFTYSKLATYAEMGGFYDYTNALPTYAPSLKSIIDSDAQYKKDMTTYNGGMHILPMFSAIKNEKMYIIRKDWLDKVSEPVPETIDDLKRVMSKFKNIPSGITPFVFDNGLNGMNLYESFGVDMAVGAHTGFFVEDGQIKYGPADPRMKNFIALAQDMYNNNYINRNYENPGTNEGADILFETGKAGITFGYGTRIDRYQQKLDLLPRTAPNEAPDVIGFLPPKNGADGQVMTRRQLLPVRDEGAAAIFKDSKYKNEILRVFDFIYSDEGQLLLNFGIEGEQYTMADGQPQYTDKITAAKHIKDNYDIAAADALRMYGIAIDFPSKQDLRYETQVASQKVRDIRAQYDQIILPPVPNLKFTSYEMSVIGQYLYNLEQYYQGELNAFVKGKSLDNWDAYINSLTSKARGLETVLNTYNAAYQRYLAS